MRARTAVAVTAALLTVLLCGATAGAATPTFLTPAKLTGAAGGEPSIATDGKGNVYVDGPQGIPAGANDSAGVGFWASHDDGTSWGAGQNLGSFLGGGDSDVITTPNGDVYIDDLEAVASQVCKSTDHGKTFASIGPTPDPDNCSHVGIGQVGPSDDRPWLTSDSKGTLYLTYHEFVSAQPAVFRSDNGGNDLFTAGPCGPIVSDPSIEANVPTDITGGTLVGKPVTDAAGNLYILFATTTQQQNAAAFAAGQPSGTFSQLYVAVSTDHCQSFTDHTVFDGSALGTNTVQFGDIFNALTIDGAGNLYSVGTGYVSSTPFAKTANTYLFSSTNHGVSWSKPTLVGSTNAAHMLPAAVGGPQGGQLALGYFRTTNGVTDPNDTAGKWTYGVAETTDATSASPSFTYADVNPGALYHVGQICNEGILCGLPGQPSDRSLLDFTAATIDAQGCPLFTFAGNPDGVSKGTFNYATRQITGCMALAPISGGAVLLTPGGGSGSGAPGTGTGSGGSGSGAPGTGTLPATGGCIAANRLVFRINPVPHGRVVRAVAFINGRRVLRVSGRNIKQIAFRRPAGSRLLVRIVTTNNKGGLVVTRRTFRGCTRTRVVGRVHRHKVTHKKKK